MTSTPDIVELVELLRAYAGMAHGDGVEDSLEWKAAAELERMITVEEDHIQGCEIIIELKEKERALLSRLSRMEEALRSMLATFNTPDNGSLPGAEQEACNLARAALEDQT